MRKATPQPTRAQRAMLRLKQGLSLEDKEALSLERIGEWYEGQGGKVYVAFSGGKDSTVLLHMVRRLYPDMKGIFVDTGLEYPEIKAFVKATENVEIIRPEKTFLQVIREYGYPIISKDIAAKIFSIRHTKSEKFKYNLLHGEGAQKLPERYKYLIDSDIPISRMCCYHLKKRPSFRYQKESGCVPFVGTMASDSQMREKNYMITGCNNWSGQHPLSMPLGFWLEKDIWAYIEKYRVPYSKIYDMGYRRTGCIFCMFGIMAEGYPNRFQLLQKSHPQLHKYAMEKLGLEHVCELLGIKPYDELFIKND
ncbi:MAG: phosphoadenosine phosphosulfate reductase family protein [Candidatus Moranbacteria bacterium]|nr:phosphoadenosine phosphosulfate reductase family protein [Candidatus Moranbacteria bacterium]